MESNGYAIPPVLSLPHAAVPVSRTVPAGRVRRLRVSWFTLGMLAGCALTFQATRFFSDAPALPEMPAPVATTPEAPAPQAKAAPTPIVAQAAPTEAPDTTPQIAYPLSIEFKTTKGDSLASLITQYHVPRAQAATIIAAMKKVMNPRDIAAGRQVSLELDKEPEADFPYVEAMHIEASALDTVEVLRGGTGYQATRIRAPISRVMAHAGGKVRGNFSAAAKGAGIPSPMVAQIIKAFSYDVDFQHDLVPGDRFDAVYERYQTDKGVGVKNGKLLYAALTVDGKLHEVFSFTGPDGKTQFYNARGEGTKKSLLRTPINGAQITSGFGMRLHPLLGYNKMHKGLDFGAPTGAPIYAAGDGVIQKAGPYMGYGNYVRIQHTAAYGTAYGHMSRFAKGIRVGMRVKQGQVIGYVGSTGRSTGPHLHYEVLVMGNQVNPSKVTFKTGGQLEGKNFAAFKKYRAQLRQVASVPVKKNKQQQVASR